MTSMDIEFSDVTKRYGDVIALDGVTFSAKGGRVTGFVGKNGAGKTTALRILLGLVRPEAGSATIAGKRVYDLPLGSLGVSLEPAFHPGRTGRQHLLCLSAALGLSEESVGAVLEELDLTRVADKRAGGYSLGQRQRLGLAAGLLGGPQVLVLDEPANGLDPDGVIWLRGRLRAVADAGGTVLLSSHILSELEHVVDDLIVLHKSVLWSNTREAAIEQAGSLEQLYRRVEGEAA